ncbi:3-oxoacyl-[acyl-carrier-protein] reductase [Acidobacteriota bacterium]
MFSDKTAIVTGASRGIGREISTKLLQNRCRVAGFDMDSEGLRDFQSHAEKSGWDLITRCVDVSDEKNATSAVEDTLEAFGKLDYLVNNAGIVRDCLLARMTTENWNTVLNVNLNGVFFLTRAVIRPMMKARTGRIVNISSIVALIGNPGQTNYAASKAGIIGFTKALALEVATRGVTVNAVAPGFIDTDMTRGLKEEARSRLIERIPAGRLGTSSDIASAVLFLLGEGASYMTGQVLEVNGGMHLG